jgi:hypothetical protein
MISLSMELITDEKKQNILEITSHEEAEIVYIKSNKNHPWRKDNIFGKTMPPIKNDEDHAIRNMTWWNNYEPSHYQSQLYKKLNKKQPEQK